jgi:RNA polymerase sigma factor (TIGR02999 family)
VDSGVKDKIKTGRILWEGLVSYQATSIKLMLPQEYQFAPLSPASLGLPSIPNLAKSEFLETMNNSEMQVADSITGILEAVERGDGSPAEQLFPGVYRELRRLAAWKLSADAPGQTLQPTALVHEAWLRLMGVNNGHWQNRAHFFAAAGEAMRRILVENARRKRRLKRGGNFQRVELDEASLPGPMRDEDLLALDEALDKLAEFDERATQVVKLCFFVGLTRPQAAKELGVSLSTVERNWSFARAWLYREMRRGVSERGP